LLDDWTSPLSGETFYKIEFDCTRVAGCSHIMDSGGGTIQAPEGAGIEDLRVVSCEGRWTFLMHELKDARAFRDFGVCCADEVEDSLSNEYREDKWNTGQIN
jgi:hypothetical protein